MILRIPSYYEEFACIADRCRHSCCIGWEIDIDEDTYEYYMNMEGELGDKIRSMLYDEDGFHSFRLQEGNRCPMLDEAGLCEIISKKGEEAIGEICTEFPRFNFDFGNYREKGIAISCEEAARIIFSHTDKMTLKEISIPEEYEWGEEYEMPRAGDGDEEDCAVLEDEEDEDPDEEDRILAITAARDRILELLQDRSQSLQDRLNTFLAYAGLVQDRIGESDWEGLKELAIEPLKEDRAETGGELADDALLFYPGMSFEARMQLLDGCEPLDEEWVEFAKRLKQHYQSEGDAVYWQEGAALDAFLHRQKVSSAKQSQAPAGIRAHVTAENNADSNIIPDRSVEYEQLLVYFAFRYLMKSVYDYQFLTKCHLAAFSLQTLHDMDAMIFAEKGDFSEKDRQDTVRIYTREIEHSEDNLAYLEENFLFG